MEFLSTLEQHVVCKEQFHQTKWYQNFIHKWNLPVYYQIRFQEIASPVEEACSDSKFFETTDAASDAAPLSIGFHLKVSQVGSCVVMEPGGLKKNNQKSTKNNRVGQQDKMLCFFIFLWYLILQRISASSEIHCEKSFENENSTCSSACSKVFQPNYNRNANFSVTIIITITIFSRQSWKQ